MTQRYHYPSIWRTRIFILVVWAGILLWSQLLYIVLTRMTINKFNWVQCYVSFLTNPLCCFKFNLKWLLYHSYSQRFSNPPARYIWKTGRKNFNESSSVSKMGGKIPTSCNCESRKFHRNFVKCNAWHPFQDSCRFFSTPVHMHGGLICITLRPSVCLWLDQNSE